MNFFCEVPAARMCRKNIVLIQPAEKILGASKQKTKSEQIDAVGNFGEKSSF